MLRKKVLSVGATSATLLVEDSAERGAFKVLQRINVASWSAVELEETQRLFTAIAQKPVPVMVDVEQVVCQNSFLNIVTSYQPGGTLGDWVKTKLTAPPSDAQIAQWTHVAALAVGSIHKLGHVHAAVRLDSVYLSPEKGAAGVVIGAPLPLTLYREMIDAARCRTSSVSPDSSQPAASTTGEKSAAEGPNVSTLSLQSLELHFPPEALQSPFRYDKRSDVWHIGALLMALASAHQGLPQRSGIIQDLVNDMCSDDPCERPTLDEILERLKGVYQEKNSNRVNADQNVPADDATTSSYPSPSPEPQDPQLSCRNTTLKGVPTAKQQPVPLLSIPAPYKPATVATQPASGIVLTPRSDTGAAPAARTNSTGPSRRTGQRSGNEVPRYATPTGGVGAPLRSRSKPTTTTARRAVHVAHASHYVDAVFMENADLQRRRDELLRDQQRRKDEAEKEIRNMQEAHRQHASNLKKIRGSASNRELIRKSINQWQSQQVGIVGDSGVAIFAKPYVGAHQASDVDVHVHRRRDHHVIDGDGGVHLNADTVNDCEDEAQQRHSPRNAVLSSSAAPRRQEPVALDITPPRRRHQHNSAAATSGSPLARAMSAELERHGVVDAAQVTAPLSLATSREESLSSTAADQSAFPAHTSNHNLFATAVEQPLARTRTPEGVVVSMRPSPDPPQAAAQPPIQQPLTADVKSDGPSTRLQHSGAAEVAALAAMEFTLDALHKQLGKVLGPLRHELQVSILRVVDAYVTLPASRRATPASISALSKTVERLLLSDGDVVGLIIPLVSQIAAVESVAALARELTSAGVE